MEPSFQPQLAEISPPPRPGARFWGGWATFGFGAAIFALYFIAQSLVAIFFFLGELVRNPDLLTSPDLLISAVGRLSSSGLVLATATCVSGVVGLGMTTVFIRLRKTAGVMDYLGLRPISGKTVLLLLGLTVGVLVLVQLAATLTGQTGEGSSFMIEGYRSSVSPPFFWVAMVLFAPAFEEGFFRGFLFAGWRYSRLGAAGTIVLTAFLWSLLHIQYDFFGMGTIFVLGIVIGIARLKTGSLWGALVIHSFWNLLAMVLTVLAINGVIK